MTIEMKPVCSNCGYVFHDLTYNTKYKSFHPFYCPNCKEIISTIQVQDISKFLPDKDFNITIISENPYEFHTAKEN